MLLEGHNTGVQALVNLDVNVAGLSAAVYEAPLPGIGVVRDKGDAESDPIDGPSLLLPAGMSIRSADLALVPGHFGGKVFDALGKVRKCLGQDPNVGIGTYEGSPKGAPKGISGPPDFGFGSGRAHNHHSKEQRFPGASRSLGAAS